MSLPYADYIEEKRKVKGGADGKIGLEGLDPKVVQNRTIVNWSITVATFPFLFPLSFFLYILFVQISLYFPYYTLL